VERNLVHANVTQTAERSRLTAHHDDVSIHCIQEDPCVLLGNTVRTEGAGGPLQPFLFTDIANVFVKTSPFTFGRS
jgi:hypothetical protein